LGERTSEDIKIKIGSAFPQGEELQMTMRGRDLVSGLPKEVVVTDAHIRQAMQKSIRAIVNTIKDTIEETPPELLADIMARGIHLAGGGSLLRGLDRLVEIETKVKTKIVDDSLTAVVRGCGIVLENLDSLKEVLVNEEYQAPPS
jgi:rod shape-determining protein MreB